MLKISDLTKNYSGGVEALQDVTLEISPGIFGLLGPNGAGKTTLMRTLASLQLPTKGTAILDGIDIIKEPKKAREVIGYLPQEMGVYPRVTAREMLNYFAGLKGVGSKHGRATIVDAQLEKVNLLQVADRRVDTFSGGMRQRFGIAVALLGKPKLVIVDEPTAGLDPSERRRFQLMLTEAARDCILILSSHIVEDIAGLCSDMALVNHGRVLLNGSPSELIKELNGCVWEFRIATSDFNNCRDQFRILSWKPVQGKVIMRVWAKDDEKLNSYGAQKVEPNLEDLYSFHTSEDSA